MAGQARDPPARHVAHSGAPTHPAAEAVARRIIGDITAPRTPAATELPSLRQLAATYGVNVDVVREGLRLAAVREAVALVPGRPATVILPLPTARRAPSGTVSR